MHIILHGDAKNKTLEDWHSVNSWQPLSWKYSTKVVSIRFVVTTNVQSLMLQWLPEHDLYDWHVNNQDTMSDHRQICFALRRDRPNSKRIRNRRNTNWNVYEQEVEGKDSIRRIKPQNQKTGNYIKKQEELLEGYLDAANVNHGTVSVLILKQYMNQLDYTRFSAKIVQPK